MSSGDMVIGQPASSAALRIALVDDHLLFGQAMAIALKMRGNEVLRPVLPAERGLLSTVATSIELFGPDVALVDLDLGRAGDGVSLVRDLADRDIAVLVLTGSSDRYRWGAALHRGARAVIEKTGPLDEIFVAIRRVSEGASIMAPEDREVLIRRWLGREREQGLLRERLSRLTAGEGEVLTQLTLGHTVTEIAASRTVSEATVRTQVRSVLAKLEVSSQIAAVGMAHQAGWPPRKPAPPPADRPRRP